MIETSVTKELMWELSFQEMAKYFLVHDEFLESIKCKHNRKNLKESG